MSFVDNLPILTVTQLTNAIKHCLEKTFPFLLLQGEISNCKLHTSGHLYFSLKDANAQISAVMFRLEAVNLLFQPKDGMQVLIQGELNVFPQNGKYQILVKEMKPVGIGELLFRLEQLKNQLNKRGWFKKEHKKALPKFPKKIGIVTSPTGAVIRDILHILTRRFAGFHVIINPVAVQGVGAAQEIARAIRQFNQYNLVDVMIVGRGGGSMEDLWPFNEELVAEAIFTSHIPVISAVGHETDHCIADYVADVRAPTPSAAAELVIAEKAHQIEILHSIKKRVRLYTLSVIKKEKEALNRLLRHSLFQSPYGLLGPWMQKLDSLKEDCDRTLSQKREKWRMLLMAKQKLLVISNPLNRIRHLKQKFHYWEKTLSTTFLFRLKSLRHRLDAEAKKKNIYSLWQKNWQKRQAKLIAIQAMLNAIDPKNLLTKGYCILFSEKDHSAITSVHKVKKEQEIRVMLRDGEILSIVKEVIVK